MATNDVPFFILQDHDGSHLDSGKVIGCYSEYPQVIFCLFNGDFLCDEQIPIFRDNDHSSRTSFWLNFHWICPSLVYLYAIRMMLN